MSVYPFSNGLGNEWNPPPASRQHFDVSLFQTADQSGGQQSYVGALLGV
jgi:hypothetical protein